MGMSLQSQFSNGWALKEFGNAKFKDLRLGPEGPFV